MTRKDTDYTETPRESVPREAVLSVQSVYGFPFEF